MIHEPQDANQESPEAQQQAVDEIVSRGPGGALAVAGSAVLIVLAIWFAFYFWVFIPRS
jgi:uncharacterized protein HemX